MTTLVIQSDKRKSRLIANLAKELGGKVYDASNDIIEDIACDVNTGRGTATVIHADRSAIRQWHDI